MTFLKDPLVTAFLKNSGANSTKQAASFSLIQVESVCLDMTDIFLVNSGIIGFLLNDSFFGLLYYSKTVRVFNLLINYYFRSLLMSLEN